jgi:hypothetical protein
MTAQHRPTFGQLLRLLEDLHFTVEPARAGIRAYRHAGSDSLLVFADHAESDPAREADVVAVRKQLIERGLITGAEFGSRIAEFAPSPETGAGE